VAEKSINAYLPSLVSVLIAGEEARFKVEIDFG
jgi:hypothetical protein